MAKSYVLKALKIFGLEEMFSLARAEKLGRTQMKKAAGEELIFWDESSEVDREGAKKGPTEENVLLFKRPAQEHSQAENRPDPEQQDSSSTFLSSEFMLWQRELSKEANSPVSKKDAFKGYSKASDMYVVKDTGSTTKDKMKFASTHGVLINKKQA